MLYLILFLIYLYRYNAKKQRVLLKWYSQLDNSYQWKLFVTSCIQIYNFNDSETTKKQIKESAFKTSRYE